MIFRQSDQAFPGIKETEEEWSGDRQRGELVARGQDKDMCAACLGTATYQTVRKAREVSFSIMKRIAWKRVT